MEPVVQPTSFLVAFEYGHGAVFAMVRAESIEDVLAAGPELVHHRQAPEALTEEDLAKLEANVIDLAALGHNSLADAILLSRLNA